MEARVQWREWIEQGSTIEVDVGVGGAKSVIKVKSRRGHEWSAKDFSESVREITVVGIVVIVIVGQHSACACIGMPVETATHRQWDTSRGITTHNRQRCQ